MFSIFLSDIVGGDGAPSVSPANSGGRVRVVMPPRFFGAVRLDLH